MDGADECADAPVVIDPSILLLRHCLSLGASGEERPPAKLRLEQAIGPDLTRRLLKSLTNADRR